MSALFVLILVSQVDVTRAAAWKSDRPIVSIVLGSAVGLAAEALADQSSRGLPAVSDRRFSIDGERVTRAEFLVRGGIRVALFAADVSTEGCVCYESSSVYRGVSVETSIEIMDDCVRITAVATGDLGNRVRSATMRAVFRERSGSTAVEVGVTVMVRAPKVVRCLVDRVAGRELATILTDVTETAGRVCDRGHAVLGVVREFVEGVTDDPWTKRRNAAWGRPRW